MSVFPMRGRRRDRLFQLRNELWRLIVELDLGREGLRHVGVVAANLGEGASTVARALSLASGQLVKQRTILVDADPHARGRSAIARRLGLGKQQGLLDWRPGQPAPLKEIADQPGIAFLAIGEGPTEGLATMIADGRVDTLAATLASGDERTLVVWDLPPLKRHPEAKAMTKMLDGVILVTEADRALVSDAQFAAAEVRGAGVPVLAGILNRSGRYSLGLRG